MKRLFSIRVLLLLLAAAAIAFSLRYVREFLLQQFPGQSQLIGMLVIVLYAILLAYVVMAPLAEHFGFKIIGKSPVAPKDHGNET